MARLAQGFEFVLADTAVSLLDRAGRVLWSGVSDGEGRVVASGIAGHVCVAVVAPSLPVVTPSDTVHVTLRFPLSTR